jgi:CHASE2 domain-containing sensor protein
MPRLRFRRRAVSGRAEAEQRMLWPLMACVGALCAGLVLLIPAARSKLNEQQYWTSDWRSALLADHMRDFHKRIVIVSIDVDSLGGVLVPVPREYNARLIRAVDAMGPRVIGFDFYFVQPQPEEKTRLLVDAINDAKSLVLGGVDATAREFTEAQFKYQASFLARCNKPIGYINLNNNETGVVRDTEPPLEGSPFQESFARTIYRAANPGVQPPDDTIRPIAWLTGPGPDGSPFLTIPAKEILSPASEAERAAVAAQIKDRVVLIGIDLTQIDSFRTPMTLLTGRKMRGVAVHAQTLAQMLDGRALDTLNGREALYFLGSLAAAGLVLSWLLWRRSNFLSLGVAAAILVAADAALYYWFRLVLPITFALFVWFLAVLAGRNLHVLANHFWRSLRGRRAARSQPAAT